VSPHPERFAIDGGLLAGRDGDGRWNNLGYWRQADGYSDACAALARLHGQAAGLVEGQTILELACGYGAALDLWRQEFSVGSVFGLEYREHCTQFINSTGFINDTGLINDARIINDAQKSSLPIPVNPQTVIAGRFDKPLPESLKHCSVDAVICVDAAYHAHSLKDFLCCLSPVLKTNGRLVFSTLVRSDNAASFWQRQRNRVLLRLASMPDASVLSASELQESLDQQGFDVTLEDISEDVFSGFAQWVRQRQQALSPGQRCSPAWLKIRFTARWCEMLAADRSLRYMMVSATKRAPV